MNTVLMLARQVPYIDPDIEIGTSNLDLIVPTGYDDIIKTSFEDGNIIFQCKNPENSFIDSITLKPVLFNNHLHESSTLPAGFIFSESNLRHCNYFDEDKELVLNIRQVIYLLLQHRFAIWARHDRQYTDLLNKDLKNLSTFIEYVKPCTFNALLKVRSSYAIINPQVDGGEYYSALGEWIHATRFDEKEWGEVLRDLPIDISSETAMSSSNKVTVLKPGEQFKAVAHTIGNDEGGHYFTSIFPPKQNIAARLKTHVLSNAYEIDKPDLSCFLSNLSTTIDENGKTILTSRDRCLKEALVVFDHMEKDSLRFVAGEIESSLNIADTEVHLIKKFDVDYLDPDNKLEIGETYTPNFKHIVIGLDEDRDPIYLKNVRKFTVLAIKNTGPNGVLELKLDLTIKAGNARIISDTALKGVTKTKPKLGYLTMVNPKVDVTKQRLAPTVLQRLKKNDYESFDPLDPRMMHLPVDLIAGMNAVKAKDNTIALAQAAFAVKYGFYKPRTKMSFEGLLNDRDEAEINAAAQSLPDFEFTDEFGNTRKVKFGIVHIMYTELGEIYGRFKKQAFAFEAGKNINQNQPLLYQHIQENYLEQDRIELALELAKCLYDTKGYLNQVETEISLPIYNIKQIRSIFKEFDLILRRTEFFPSNSKLLDEEWNQGFLINLGKPGFPVIRIPSARVLNRLVGELKSGEITYHAVIINISKILRNIIGTQEYGFQPSLPFIYAPLSGRHTSFDLYQKSLQGTIFSEEEAAEMKLQCLIKPMIYGVNMKQVVEHRLPPNTLVLMDDRIYAKFCKISAGEMYKDKPFREIGDNPTFLELLNEYCPSIYATHSPHLWMSQSFAPIIWDRQTYALYLKVTHGIDLDSYLYTYTNDDIVLIHPMLALRAKKDLLV